MLSTTAAAAATLAAALSLYALVPYFPEGPGAYAERFMGLEEVEALHGAYGGVRPGLAADGAISYGAAGGGGAAVELSVIHGRHSFEVAGLRLTCWGGDGAVAWRATEDVLGAIIDRRCF